MRSKKTEVRSKKTEDRRFSVLLIFALLLSFMTMPVAAQTVGNFQMDEANLYAMTKQMGQFIRRFNYEEDQFGNKINPKDPSYRNRQKRQQSLSILFDQATYGSQPDLQRFFIEDVTADDSTFMLFPFQPCAWQRRFRRW